MKSTAVLDNYLLIFKTFPSAHSIKRKFIIKMRIYELNDLDVRALLQAEGFEKKTIDKLEWKVHFVITRILFRYFRKSKEHGKGYVWISKQQLEDVLGQVKSNTLPKRFRSGKVNTLVYPLIRKLLYKWGVILFKKFTTEHPKEKTVYKLMDESYFKGWTDFSGKISNKNKVKIQSLTENLSPPLNPDYKYLYDGFLSVNLNEEEALDWIISAYKKRIKLRDRQDHFGRWCENVFDEFSLSYYKMHIDNFKNHKYFSVGKRSPRAYHNGANFPSSLRRFLTIDDEPLLEYDISCAQPYLLNELLGFTCSAHYAALTYYGELNFYLHRLAIDEEIPFETPSNLKVDVLKDVFFSTGKRKTKLYRAFEKCFPYEIEQIENIKKDDHSELAVQLQSLEAQKLIEASKILVERYGVTKFMSIHDCIMCKESDFYYVKSALDEVYYGRFQKKY